MATVEQQYYLVTIH